MRKRTLYYLPLVSLLMLLAGCTKEEGFVPQGGDANTLVFNATLDGMSLSNDNITSRAVTDMTVENFKTYGFDVAGYYTEGTFEAAFAAAPAKVYPNVFDKDLNDKQIAVPRVMVNEKGKYSLKTVKWKLDDQTYLSFFAWGQNAKRPSEGGTHGIVSYTKSADDNTGYPKLRVNVPADQTKNCDIVGARVMNSKNDAVISTVDLEFHHLLAKITIKAKSSTGNKITFSSAKFSGKGYHSADYTFGSNPAQLGTWSNYSSEEEFNRPMDNPTATINAGAVSTLNTGLYMPQSFTKGALNIEVTYKIELAPGGVMSHAITKKLPVPAIELKENTNHVITLDFVDNDAVTFNTSIAPWTEVTQNTLPYIPGPRGEVQLEFSGYDPPYYDIATGKSYWLDRSGYNRHAELGDGVTHDAATHSYKFLSGNAYASIDLFNTGSEAATVELIAEVPNGTTLNKSQQIAFHFSAYADFNGNQSRSIFTHLGYEGGEGVFFDTRGSVSSGRISESMPTGGPSVKQRALWTYTVGELGATTPGKYTLEFYRNANSMKKDDERTATGDIKSLYGRIGGGYIGNIAYLRLTSKVKDATEVLSGYSKLVGKYAIPKDVNPTQPKPPHSDKMVLWLDGYNAPKTENGTTFWLSAVNDAEGNPVRATHLTNENSSISWTGSGYQFNDGAHMELRDINLGSADNGHTYEMIFVTAAKYKAARQVLLCAGSSSLVRPVEFTWESGTSGLNARTGYNNNLSDPAYKQNVLNKNLSQPLSTPVVWQVTRNSTDQWVYCDATTPQKAGGSNPSNPAKAPEWSYGKIGLFGWESLTSPASAFIGEYKALVIHNKVLSEEELAANRAWYKAYYGLE